MIALATWSHGVEPNRVAYKLLNEGGSALDAVERGASYCEADLTCMSVGRGSLPDDRGMVTLDASIMDDRGNAGSVAFVQNYLEVTTLARRVMEKTGHVMLVGTGAEDFAQEQGFQKTDLMSPIALEIYSKWHAHPNKMRIRLRRVQEGAHEYSLEEIADDGEKLVSQWDRTTGKNESHDTIGLLALDSEGHFAGACTTSGLAFKKHGRVGDSPIIGAGLYVDGNVGAAVATGNGELVMRALSSFNIVELMGQGVSPEKACDIAIARIARDPHLTEEMQVGLIALRKDGTWSSRALRPGFQFAMQSSTSENVRLYDCDDLGFHIASHVQ